MTAADLSTAEFYFVIASAVIFGTALTGVAFMAIIRYSRAEEAGKEGRFYDLILTILAGVVCLYGMYLAFY